jgi:formiminoglutamase
MKALHKKTDPDTWKGRAADSVQYWHQAVKCLDNLQIKDAHGVKKIAILGYAADEGVRRNQGRIGAQFGPASIRKMMGSMAFHLPENVKILDYGDISVLEEALEPAHQLLQETTFSLLKNHHFPILLGGGHDLAYAHGSAIMDYLEQKNESFGIINLDAHFDLRPLLEGKGHSGSPFLQLFERAKASNLEFHYFCLGIQSPANPKELFEIAKKTGTWWMDMEDFTLSNWDQIQNNLDAFLGKVNKVMLSIDLDGFSSAYAPGVSAPSPMGFSPELALKVLGYLAKSKKLISMDVVELNPNYDPDNGTARLAARCVEFLARKMFEGNTT